MIIRDSWFKNKGFFRVSIDYQSRDNNEIWHRTKLWTKFINAYYEKYPIYPWLTNQPSMFLIKKLNDESYAEVITPDKLKEFYKEWIKTQS